ncbi:MAG: peptidase S13, partial [Chitinophagaceae bacterium]
MVYQFRIVQCLTAAVSSLLLFSACSVNRQLSRKAAKLVLADSAIRQGHIGISIYEPATGKFWYEHNAEKYFVPASNTKLFSLYAGLKYLGDSLVGIRYIETADTLLLEPTGDPTLLHPDYPKQPVMSFLQRSKQPKVLRLN